MLVVRGTKRFLDRVGGARETETASSGTLGDWYANALTWRPQVALFVNERSLLPVLVPLAPAVSVIQRFPAAFAEIARRVGADQAALAREVATMDTYALTKTRSRRVLGVMNEFVRLANAYRAEQDALDLVELSLWLAEVPCTPLRESTGFPDLELNLLLS